LIVVIIVWPWIYLAYYRWAIVHFSFIILKLLLLNLFLSKLFINFFYQTFLGSCL
jgi:hypothetical protein